MPDASRNLGPERCARPEIKKMKKDSASNTIRFGVSLDADLLKMFDAICASRGYTNRSEAIRDLIRTTFVEEKWGDEEIACGVLTLVYDHHRNDLARRLIAIQHDFHDLIVTTMHFHMDHANCLEILVLKGAPAQLRDLSHHLISVTGVKYGVFNPVPQGKEFR